MLFSRFGMELVIEKVMLNGRQEPRTQSTGIHDGAALEMPYEPFKGLEQAPVLEARSQAMHRYEDCLVAAEVAIRRPLRPDLSDYAEMALPDVEPRQWTTALEMMAETRSARIREGVIAACMDQSMRVADTIKGPQPLGFDPRFDHFHIPLDSSPSTVFVEPSSPPRLMFSEDSSGKNRRMPFADLLVDYPKGPESFERLEEFPQRLLREMYYVREGIALNVVVWSIAARYAGSTRCEQYQSVMWGGAECVSTCCDTVDADLRESLERAVSNPALERYINFRMAQAWQLYRNLSDERRSKASA